MNRWNRTFVNVAVLSFSFFAFAESIPSVKGVSVPGVKPVAPVNQPSIGSDFYAPKLDDFYAGATIKNSSNNSIPPGMKTEESKTASTSQNPTEILKKINSSSVFFKTNPLLSAADLENLDLSGDYTNLSALLSDDKLATLSARKILTSADISGKANADLLNKILIELENLKKNIKTVPQTVAFESSSTNDDKRILKNKDNSKILRFIVNGYNVLSTCKTVHFSDKESDGTFLLTADRIYASNNQNRTETFYLLFKAVGSDSGVTEYKVAGDVSQDYENKLSFLYQLAQKQNLTAQRTGNLITMRVKENAWNMDLLIDAGSR